MTTLVIAPREGKAVSLGGFGARHADRKPQDDYQLTEEWVDFVLFIAIGAFEFLYNQKTEEMRTFVPRLSRRAGKCQIVVISVRGELVGARVCLQAFFP